MSPGEQEGKILKRAKVSALVGASVPDTPSDAPSWCGPVPTSDTQSQLRQQDVALPAQQPNCDECISDIELAGCSKNLICEREQH